MTVSLRLYSAADVPHLFAINEAGVPGVGKVTREEFARLLTLGTAIVASDARTDAPLGFINLVAPGTAAYPSKNLRWLEAWSMDHIYVDRVAVAPEARGQRIGEALYHDAMARFAGEVRQMTCEVNTVPPNPGSMRFHERLGFDVIGRAEWTPDYHVAFLACALA